MLEVRVLRWRSFGCLLSYGFRDGLPPPSLRHHSDCQDQHENERGSALNKKLQTQRYAKVFAKHAKRSPLRSFASTFAFRSNVHHLDRSLHGLITNRQWPLNYLALHLWIVLVRQRKRAAHGDRQINSLNFLLASPKDAGLSDFAADDIRNRICAWLDVGEIGRALAICHHRHDPGPRGFFGLLDQCV